MRKAIIIDLYPHTPADEVADILADLERLGFSNDPRYVESRSLTEIEIEARGMVYEAHQAGTAVTLDADQARALWESMLLSAHR